MTLRVKQISICERDELEPMIAANPDMVEQGLRIIFMSQQTGLLQGHFGVTFVAL